MGNQLCTGPGSQEIKLPTIVPKLQGQIKQKEMKEIQASSFPLLKKNIEERIRNLTKIHHNPYKVWKMKYPNNIVYANADQNYTQSLPKGYVQLYQLKENGDFQAYFQGYLDQNYKPIFNEQSICVFHNGSYFQGTGVNQGSYVKESKQLYYSGGWQNQQPQGFGQQKIKNNTYKGQYNLGKKQGHGILKCSDGVTFEGSFTNGQFNGKGILQDPGKKYSYEGQFKNGQKHGFGIEKQQFQIYEGFFYKGERYGKGNLRVFNNDKTIKMMFQGNFYQGVPNGKGKISKPNINVVEGIWEDGHLIAVQ